VEVLEVFVVGSNNDRVIGTQEVGVATFKSVDNGSHLFIMDVIVSFCWEEGMEVEGDRVSSICELLTNDCSKGKVGGIGVHKELLHPIRGSKYRV
jgi:hypothetical protein